MTDYSLDTSWSRERSICVNCSITVFKNSLKISTCNSRHSCTFATKNLRLLQVQCFYLKHFHRNKVFKPGDLSKVIFRKKKNKEEKKKINWMKINPTLFIIVSLIHREAKTATEMIQIKINEESVFSVCWVWLGWGQGCVLGWWPKQCWYHRGCEDSALASTFHFPQSLSPLGCL